MRRRTRTWSCTTRAAPTTPRSPRPKAEFWDNYWAEHRRREAIKRALYRVPFVARLNARRNWFVPPEKVSSAPQA